MFETYSDIFNQRGQFYHQAMVKYPLARRAEFEMVLTWLRLVPGLILCDAPSGGGYLRNFVTVPDIKIYSVETSQVFAREIEDGLNNQNLFCHSISDLPLASNSIDRVLSLAGLHHVDPQIDFYQEAYRILSPGSSLLVADVRTGSGVDQFLNCFVDQHSTMGHTGRFLGEHTLSELESCGFQIAAAQPESYVWILPNPEALAHYCQLLFGIDRADSETILDGIQTCLGYQMTDVGCQMNWELFFVQAIKPSVVP